MGFTDTTITLEFTVQHYLDWEKALDQTPEGVEETETAWALRATRTFWHETLEATFLGTAMGDWGNKGWFCRLQAEYDWTDRVSTLLGVVFYGSGDSELFRHIDEEDRLFLDVRLDF